MNKYHTFGRRLGAAILDGLVLYPLTYIYNTNIPSLFYIGVITVSVLSVFYYVILHGKYGQTIGKRVAGIKILDITETTVIGYKRACLRELPWIIVSIIAVVYIFAILDVQNTNNVPIALEKYNNFNAYIASGWTIIELITMFTNNKRRALHDWIATSVVVKTNIDF